MCDYDDNDVCGREREKERDRDTKRFMSHWDSTAKLIRPHT